MISNNKKFVICGTDTDVGKTIVSSFLVQGLQASYWKPIQSGLEEGGDKERVCKLLRLSDKRIIPEAYKFKAAVSPHWAAEKEQRCINPEHLELPLVEGPLILETAGGLMVPLNRKFLQIDQLKQWDLPTILVARSGLGTLNHTLLSIESLRKRMIPIIGIILNGPPHKDNPYTLELFGRIPIIAHLPHLKEVNASSLQEEWDRQNLDAAFNQFQKNHTFDFKYVNPK
tara:strand:- start:25352 stop:26035 length:684 start_codon:yes stop_codon:yes gene_type:complete